MGRRIMQADYFCKVQGCMDPQCCGSDAERAAGHAIYLFIFTRQRRVPLGSGMIDGSKTPRQAIAFLRVQIIAG